MNVEIFVTENFQNKAKPLLKKFPTLKAELKLFESSLLLNPKQGKSLGKNLFKLRLASKSKGKGKSGGFRIIYLVILEEAPKKYSVYLLSIYDKSDVANLSDKELKSLVEDFL